MGFLIFAGIVAVVGIIIWGAWFYEKKRSEALEHVAEALHFSFKRKCYDTLIRENFFDLFNKGRAKKLSNQMTGSSGDMNISIADYKYTVGSGKNSTTYSQTILIIQSAQLHLPPFTLCPENIFHKIGGMFGYKDIDFTSHPKFSKQYLLRGSDEGSIREMFNEDVLYFFEKAKGLSVEGKDDRFIYYKASKRVATKEIQAFLQEGINLYGLLKVKSSGLH
jgi:hypothetical protein